MKNMTNSTFPNNNWRNASSNNNGKPGNFQQGGYKLRNLDVRTEEEEGNNIRERKEDLEKTDGEN